jgi:hypothetical protein
MQPKWYIILSILGISLVGGIVGWRFMNVSHDMARPPVPVYLKARNTSVVNVNDEWKDLCETNSRSISRVTRFQTSDSLSAVRQFYIAALSLQETYQIAQGYSFLQEPKYSEVFIHQLGTKDATYSTIAYGFGIWVMADATNDGTFVTVSEFTYQQAQGVSCDPF